MVPASLTRLDAETPVLLYHQCPSAALLSQDLPSEQVLSALSICAGDTGYQVLHSDVSCWGNTSSYNPYLPGIGFYSEQCGISDPM